VEFRVLGPLEVRLGTEPIALPARERTLLAALLLGGGRIVSVDRLVSSLWGTESPPSAVSSLQAYVSRLRARLRAGDGGGPPGRASHGGRIHGDAAPVIRTRPQGYQLELGSARLDLLELRSLTEAARQARAGGDLAAAADLYRRAVALWRGDPLLGLASSYLVQTYAAGIEESYLAAREEYTDTRLALGSHRQLVGELEDLVARWPLRERFVAQLATALHRSGRTVDALAAVEATRRRMADEYGLDPSAELARLEVALLRNAVSEPGRAVAPFYVEIGGGGAALSAGDLLGLLQWVQVAGRRIRLVLDDDNR
jgi:DNA-binding SARP family transcriptional activator